MFATRPQGTPRPLRKAVTIPVLLADLLKSGVGNQINRRRDQAARKDRHFWRLSHAFGDVGTTD